MAPGGKQPPDKLGDKSYKCHPKIKVSFVLCLLCENVYHQSDFAKLSDTQYLSDILVICPEHAQLDLTSKFNTKTSGEISDTAKIIIAQIKSKSREEIKEEILTELQNKTQDLHNTTILDEDTELEIMKKENILLKELNKEINDKNNLLMELTKRQNTESENKKSFAQVISEPKTQPKRIPRIIVKKTNKDDKIDIKERVTHYIIKEKAIQAKQIYVKNDSEIIINCMSENSVNLTEKILQNKLSETCNIKIEQLLKPKMKVVGIDNYTKLDIKKIEQDINSRNFQEINGKCQIVHMYTNKRNGCDSVIMEVSPQIYKYIRENNNRVFVGYQRCRVFDLINVKPCYKCGRYGHSGTKCTNETVCLKCSNKHDTNMCSNQETKCPNCIFNNNKYKTNLDINHAATDINKCQIFRNKIKKMIDMTDYPIKPNIPIMDIREYRPQRRLVSQQPSTQTIINRVRESPSCIQLSTNKTNK